MKRTHNCGELNKANIGQEVILQGWVDTRRDHGNIIFIDLRDRWGITQLVFNPEQSLESHEKAEGLRSEFVIEVKGVVQERPQDTANPNLITGDIEIFVQDLRLLNRSKPVPFTLDDNIAVGEDIRLQYRYLDLRRKKMYHTFFLRHQVYQASREFLSRNDFIEVETPMLTKSTPEGARDYLVPSRVYPGKFFALPQSPQLFKQILMVSGFERYFQIVKCFRDEDLRADRQPEFTQIDLEMSFIEEDDILNITEGLMCAIFKKALGISLALPFPRLSHQDALARFGSDKPDLRWDIELKDITDCVQGIEFKIFQQIINSGGIIKGFQVSAANSFSRKQMDDLITWSQENGAKGLSWIKINGDKWEGPLQKFLTDEIKSAISDKVRLKDNDLFFIVAAKPAVANQVLSALRAKLINDLKIPPKERFSFCWILGFPLFNYNAEEDRYDSEHHPFTAPRDKDMDLLDKDPLKARAASYDLVLNGYEIASGSIRIHQPELQRKIFSLLKLKPEEVKSRFGFFLEALEYGAPPHGGIAPGLDRLVMIMVGAESLREVIAFPKTQRSICPLSEAPTEVSAQQLKELGLQIIKDQRLKST